MPEVSVEINGRKYRMACEEGQEGHLKGLADRFNDQVEQFKGSFGEIGDNRLTVMAGISVLDQLAEAEARIIAANERAQELQGQMDEMRADSQQLQQRFAKKLAEAARKIESVAKVVDETGVVSG